MRVPTQFTLILLQRRSGVQVTRTRNFHLLGHKATDAFSCRLHSNDCPFTKNACACCKPYRPSTYSGK